MKINPCTDCGSTPTVHNDSTGNTLKICLCADKIDDLIKFWNRCEEANLIRRRVPNPCTDCGNTPKISDDEYGISISCNFCGYPKNFNEKYYVKTFYDRGDSDWAINLSIDKWNEKHPIQQIGEVLI